MLCPSSGGHSPWQQSLLGRLEGLEIFIDIIENDEIEDAFEGELNAIAKKMKIRAKNKLV